MCDEKTDINERAEEAVTETNNPEASAKKAEQNVLDDEESGESGKDLFEEEKVHKSLFRRRRKDGGLSRDEWILSKINSEDIIEYLTLEQQREESLRKTKDTHEKRVVTTFQLTVSLAACVAIVYLLKDNPTILVNIIYIGGILGVCWLRKNVRGK